MIRRLLVEALENGVRKTLWKHVAHFAYRRIAGPNVTKPIGVPFNRDPEIPCAGFEPRKYKPGDWRDCQTDGHYLCKDCAHCEIKENDVHGPVLRPS